MKKYSVLLGLLFLSACGTDTANVSRSGDYVPGGMTYDQFRDHHGEGGAAAQKRFLALDRNNDGRLSNAERGNF